MMRTLPSKIEHGEACGCVCLGRGKKGKILREKSVSIKIRTGPHLRIVGVVDDRWLLWACRRRLVQRKEHKARHRAATHRTLVDLLEARVANAEVPTTTKVARVCCALVLT